MAIKLFKNKEDRDNFKNTPSTLKNPFVKDSVEEIVFKIRKNWWTNYNIKFSATINFKNGETSGTQSLEAKDFNDLVFKVDAFINEL